MEEMRNVYKIFIGKPERKRPLGRPRHRWDDSIVIMDFKEAGCEGMDWMHLAQDKNQWWAVVNVVMNFGFCKRWGIS